MMTTCAKCGLTYFRWEGGMAVSAHGCQTCGGAPMSSDGKFVIPTDRETAATIKAECPKHHAFFTLDKGCLDCIAGIRDRAAAASPGDTIKLDASESDAVRLAAFYWDGQAHPIG